MVPEGGWAPVSAANTAMVLLFGGRRYVEDAEHQQLFLGALKSLRSPQMGGWRGPILVVTDHPRLVRRLLRSNTDHLEVAVDAHEPPPRPRGGRQSELPLGIRLHRVRSIPFHAMAYKVAKSDIPSVLEAENRIREASGLAPLEYGLYLDVDIFTLCPVQGFIDYLASHYRGQELACFPQPGTPGQPLHGGLWLSHIHRSRRVLSEWRWSMHRCQLRRIPLDQVALGRVVEMRGGMDALEESIQLLPFGDLYPYLLEDEEEWRRGIFIHLNRRLREGSPDQAVHRWFLRALDLESIRAVPPGPASRWVYEPACLVVEGAERNLRRLRRAARRIDVLRRWIP